LASIRPAGILVVAAILLTAVGLRSGAAATTCTTGPVACENALQGVAAASWLPGAGGDASIQGFSTDISVDHGQTVDFKVRTPAAAYRIDIYRLGYYGGLGSRLVTTVTPAAALPQAQPDCLNDVATGLIDCGNWAVSASWPVPATAVSGLYAAHLVRTDTGGDSVAFFVVRDDERHAALLFQTSDATWEAYNAYGGNSLYVGQPAGRAYRVSYNRPLTVRDTSIRNSPLYAEWPMIQWLERNGYDVSYATDVDTARSPAALRQHVAFMSVGHDEYWSAEQRQNVLAARDAGVNLAFFSGNESFWKTRWESNWRTLVSYKESKVGGAADPADPPVSTGTWRDPRFASADGGKPENALTGTLYAVDAVRDDAISVPPRFGGLRFWRNALGPGQSATLPVGTLGYEWDVDADNGARPAGLIDLSSTPVPVATLVTDASGVNEGAGTATHSLTLYRAPSRALVFGAGTVQWSFGLSATHDGAAGSSSPPVDGRMQQATVNLLADLGAQPATLQADLVAAGASTDTVAPTATVTSPTQDALVDGRHAIAITGTAADTGGVVAGVEVSADGGQTWHPAVGTTSWTYTWTPSGFGQATIVARATDDSVNTGNPSPGVTVTLGHCPCTIFGNATPTTPATAELGAYELGVRFRSDANGFVTGIRYYRGPGNDGTHVGHLWTNTGALLGSATFTGETPTGWQQASFAAPIAVTAGTAYVASYTDPQGHYAVDRPVFATAGVDNSPLHALAAGPAGPNGVYIAGAGFPNASFQTSNYWVDVVLDATAADTNPPTVQAVAPAAAAAAAPVTAAVSATFGEPLAAASVTAASFVLRSPGGAAVAASVAYGSNTATLAPVAALAPDTVYTATVKGGAGGVADVAGNVLASDYAWSFTTAPDPATVCPCTLWTAADTPSTASVADAAAYELGLKFRSDRAGVVTGIRFYKGAANTGTHVGHLWTAAGAPLATVTFAGETATGWQQASFATPVAISANTTYVVSYLAPNGGFALDRPFFAAKGVDRGLLHALAAGVDGPNGVYAADGGFPAQSFQSSNYWVDAVFAATGPPTSGCPCSLWPASAAPVTPASADADPYELGVRFEADTAGTVTSIRFYKGAGNDGTHLAHLWDASGTLLGTATFASETASGWQQAAFATPVAIAAGQVYVASYFAPLGHYAADRPFFSLAGVDSPPLHALAADASGPNGVYAAGGGFPTWSYQSTNYWVDVAFSPSAGATDTTPPTVSAASGLQVTFSEPMAAATIGAATVFLRDASGAAAPATVSYDAASRTARLAPGAPLAAGATYTGTVKGTVTDAAGNALGSDVTWTFPQPASGCPCTIWPAATVPATPASSDATAYELGLRFRADVAGVVTGIRFYKGAGNGGAHLGHLWTGTGTLLGTVAFTSETATGWQQADLATPVAVAAGSVYVVSYTDPQGHYAADRPFFSLAGVDSPPLHALAADASGGNGVYAPDAGFPSASYQGTNYWVDLVFRPS
jgi:hypothetical protein